MKNVFVFFAALFAVSMFGAGAAVAVERTGAVVTTMTSGIYTFLEVEAGGGRYWAAVPKMDLAVGDQVDVAPGSEMKDFFSPSLNRTFPLIIFTPSVKVIGKGVPPAQSSPSKPPKAKETAGPAAVKTVEQIFADKDGLKGKQVKLRGKVVKFNAGIMGKNFLHIQDGSGKEGANDLTVTSQQMARVGDTVTVSGVLETEKDFGAGYTYKVILENATIT
ncbi:MAG: DNA-binding protein, partial [Nitrospirota bacterium]